MAALDDPARLGALCATELLDSPAEDAFDRLTRFAARLLGTPVAAVSLVDGRRQFFVSAVGLGEPWATARETPLSHSFCQHVVTSEAVLDVLDARAHPVVRDNLAVTELGVVAYLGAPLVSGGQVLGALCAIDHVPRSWSPQDRSTLLELAASVASEIELRQAVAQLREMEARNAANEQALRDSEARLRELTSARERGRESSGEPAREPARRE